MGNWKANAAFLGAVLLVVPLVMVRAPTPPEPIKRGPKDFDDVLAIAKQLGLQVGSDRADGDLHTRRIILSKTPLTRECISALVYGRPEDPAWIGKVAVYNEQWSLSDSIAVDSKLVPWGDLLLFGDADLIDKLVAFTEYRRSGE